MKSAKYTMSDSESDVEAFELDNDDFIFNTEPISSMSTDDQELQNNLLSPVKVRTFSFTNIINSTFKISISVPLENSSFFYL